MRIWCCQHIYFKIKYGKIWIIFNFSFTLYSASSRIGRGNLFLRHSVSHFPLNSGGLHVVWRNSTPRFASTPEWKNGIIKYFLECFYNFERFHNLAGLLTLAYAPAPRLATVNCWRFSFKYFYDYSVYLNIIFSQLNTLSRIAAYAGRNLVSSVFLKNHFKKQFVRWTLCNYISTIFSKLNKK